MIQFVRLYEIVSNKSQQRKTSGKSERTFENDPESQSSHQDFLSPCYSKSKWGTHYEVTWIDVTMISLFFTLVLDWRRGG